MKITHVIRAEEHLPNTPKQQLIWEALGHPAPIWAHVPVVVNEKRQKLSKRRDKVSLEAYRDEGYLASAMRNYLMLLGWAPSGDREIVPWPVIEEEFRLEEVNPSPAFFDEKKLRAFNGEYIRALSTEDFIVACRPWLTPGGSPGDPPWRPEQYDPAVFAQVAPLAQTRVAVLAEIVALVDFLFLAEPEIDQSSWDKAMTGPAEAILRETLAAWAQTPVSASGSAPAADWQADALKASVEAVGGGLGLKLGKAQAPLRVAITGRSVGLPLFESVQVLGRERGLARLRAALSRLP